MFSILRSSIAISLLVSASCFPSPREDAAEPAVPSGWSIYPTPKAPNDALNCANYSELEWRIVSANGSVKIERLPQFNGKFRDGDKPLPFRLKQERGMIGDRRTLKIRGGWLLGFDAGEFGGGLWWSNDDGSISRKLLDHNIRGIISTSPILILADAPLRRGAREKGSDGNTVDDPLSGLRSSGEIFAISEDNGESMHLIANLDGMPQTFVQESDNFILVTTETGVFRVNPNGAVEALAHGLFWGVYPNSMAISHDGTIYIGMRMFVVRLIPQSGGYTEEWLLPNECRSFKIRDMECACRGNGKP